jgi:23S rRNA (cytosine1962-C5)-methyltransferase
VLASHTPVPYIKAQSFEANRPIVSKRPIIRLKPREGRRVRAGAPWVFSNELTMDERARALAPGTLVGLAAEDGTVMGTGYFNPRSLIAVRMLAGADAVVDKSFFIEKFRHALALRKRFYDTPFYRLVHAEGDALPGLVIDRFGDVCVVQIATAGMERLKEPMLEALDAVIAPRSVILRNDVPSRALEGLDSYVEAARGEASLRIAIMENGVTYFADPMGGQKSGWYYDQRKNRAFIAELANGARVLDTYCYSGGFGVLSAARGAKEVAGLDSSQPALTLAGEAAAVNGLSERCHFVKCDVLEELDRRARAGERFDVVICDPPPFAPSRKDLEAAARAYRKLARVTAGLVSDGGVLMLASCSHNISAERFAAECAAGLSRSGRRAALVREAGAGPDHPVHPMLPETAYLKTLTYSLG